jgi:tripartite ATP-independent transporter DctP family solute receptor
LDKKTSASVEEINSAPNESRNLRQPLLANSDFQCNCAFDPGKLANLYFQKLLTVTPLRKCGLKIGEPLLAFVPCKLHILGERGVHWPNKQKRGPREFFREDILMPGSPITRRRFTQGLAAVGGMLLTTRRAHAVDFPMRQYHNQPTDSPLHKRLVQMWDAVKTETSGRVQVEIFPENNHFKDGDPDPLNLLIGGQLEFLTSAGNGLAAIVPAANVQATPFAFRSQAQVYKAMDGDIGDYLREEMNAKGVYLVPRGCFENGFHQITCATKPIHTAADLQGLKIRAPGNANYLEFWKTLGALPVGMNINKMYEALKTGVVEAQEDPLDVAELFHLYEVQKYMSMTNHSWSGYNLIANLKIWQGLPADVRQSIERNTVKFARLQRADTASLNAELRPRLTQRGMIFNDADVASFRAKLAPFYAQWKKSIGDRVWTLLEAHVGKLA